MEHTWGSRPDASRASSGTAALLQPHLSSPYPSSLSLPLLSLWVFGGGSGVTFKLLERHGGGDVATRRRAHCDASTWLVLSLPLSLPYSFCIRSLAIISRD